MRTTRQKSKGQMESPMGRANPEVEILEEEPQEEEATGQGAMVVAVNGAAAAVEITVRIPKSRLHCPVCTLPLKPPIFQCALGHLACGGCHLRPPSTGRCHACGHGGGYAHSTAMEEMVRSAKVLCPHDAYGCRTYVPYYDAAEHQLACPHAPCLCTEPGCEFAGPPPALRDHLASAHSCPVDGIRYGAELQLRLPQSDPGQHRRLLAAGDDEGGEVFFLAVGALGSTRRVAHVCPPQRRGGGGPAVRVHDPRGGRRGDGREGERGERCPGDGAGAEHRRSRGDVHGGGGVAGGAAPGTACGGSRGDAFRRPHRQDRLACGGGTVTSSLSSLGMGCSTSDMTVGVHSRMSSIISS